ncbi:M4 family metallopeptidase [Sansalvadorimonas sp. 2012CJ34-2]|uniref:Neutral metalloproteinase n=1 Tax=Parendozoicomonas callyspongiae TaxID=2942213 RepID=A0ABT0PB93_9GAMM|nr:M4 family metallopeptidase [Sansalvadorimonas sp. 2012CJ34-2]MCL6268652.1 M4 family metallopeptidase [Sansalvadorimonas sp. 2012CJ34-2]
MPTSPNFKWSLAVLASLLLLPLQVLAIDDDLLTGEDISSLEEFVLVDDASGDIEVGQVENALVQTRRFSVDNKRYVRYSQYFKGLEVVGRSVVGHFEGPVDKAGYDKAVFTGKVTRKIRIPVPEEYLSENFRNSIAAFAQDDFAGRAGVKGQVDNIDTQPVVWIDSDEKARVAYRVNFRVQPKDGRQMWPHYMIAAENNEIFQYWDNVQVLYKDQGPGGNGKTGKYVFGQGTIPDMEVTKTNNTCQLGNSNVKVISMNNGWRISSNPSPISYYCDQNTGAPVNGAWSPGNDAYVFTNMVVSMFKGWYQTPVLAWPNGNQKQLLVLVNVGQNYENAFWDGTYLAFGDGGYSYHPLVSVTIVAHELSHAFTSQHSGLFYANQSGAINEAFSDMAAIAAEYYLKQISNTAYQTVIGTSGIDWRIGDRISKGSFAMRSMYDPSAYSSAECESRVAGCDRSWNDVLTASQQISSDKRQSYIVHKGSGVMNRAFVNIVEGLNGDVRAAFALMVRANMLYWTTTTTFSEAACGVKQAAQVDGIDDRMITRSFQQVGVTPGC